MHKVYSDAQITAAAATILSTSASPNERDHARNVLRSYGVESPTSAAAAAAQQKFFGNTQSHNSK